MSEKSSLIFYSGCWLRNLATISRWFTYFDIISIVLCYYAPPRRCLVFIICSVGVSSLQVQQFWMLLAGAADAVLLGMVGGTSTFLDRPQPHHHHWPGHQCFHHTCACLLLSNCHRAGLSSHVTSHGRKHATHKTQAKNERLLICSGLDR